MNRLHQERAVGDTLDLDSVDSSDALDDARQVVGVGRVHGHVPHLGALVDANEVDGPE